jgi:hypothetical protein
VVDCCVADDSHPTLASRVRMAATSITPTPNNRWRDREPPICPRRGAGEIVRPRRLIGRVRAAPQLHR